MKCFMCLVLFNHLHSRGTRQEGYIESLAVGLGR